MKQLKLYGVLLLMLIIACKTMSFNVGKSTKQIHYPGIKSGTSFIKYKVVFKSEDIFVIERILLNDENINNYELYNVHLRRYVKTNSSHNNGDYILTFKKKDIRRIDTKDMLSLVLKGKFRTEKINVDVRKIKPSRKR